MDNALDIITSLRSHPLHYDTCESCGGIFLESEFKDASDYKAASKEIIDFFKTFSRPKKKVGAA